MSLWRFSPSVTDSYSPAKYIAARQEVFQFYAAPFPNQFNGFELKS